MLLEDSLGVMGSGEWMKSLVFFDIGKLEAELVQIVKQEEVCTLHIERGEEVHLMKLLFCVQAELRMAHSSCQHRLQKRRALVVK